jgi:hypothetical protein
VQHPSWFGRSGVSVLCLRGFSLCHAGFSKRRATARPDEPPTPGPGQLAALIRYRSPTAVAYPPQCAGMDTQGAAGGFAAQPTRQRQLRARRDDLSDQHGQHQIPLPRRRRVDQLGHAQPLRGAGHRGHMPVRRWTAAECRPSPPSEWKSGRPNRNEQILDGGTSPPRRRARRRREPPAQRGSHDKMPDERLV